MEIEFRGVEEALARATRGQIAFLCGPWVYEEVSSYANTLGGSGFGNIIIGEAGFTITHMMRGRYRGRTKVLDKVGGYLDRTAPNSPIGVGDSIRAGDIDKRAVVEAGVVEYIQSRRLRENAEHEAREYLSHLLDLPLVDPVVFSAQEALSFSQLLILAKWLDLPVDERPRLVICSNQVGRWIDAREPVKRRPLSLDELKYAVGEAIGASAEQIESYLRIWDATQRRTRDYGYIAAYEANSFLNVAERLHAEAPSIQDVAEQIPTFVPAPVMFTEEANLIGLDRAAQQGADPMHVRGAARALKHQTQELANAGIDNAIPRCTIALSRIAVIFERLERTSPTEQADVIELGVEINSLSRRALEAQERLSDYAAREVIGFLSEANSFIRRFDTWRTYEEAVPSSPADERTAAAALVVLENAVKDGLLTAEAKQRLSASFVGSPDLGDPGSREGVARTTDSLTAAVSRRAIKSLKEAGTQFEKEGTKRAVNASLDFITENSAQLVAFASARAPWLGLALRFLSQIGN